MTRDTPQFSHNPSNLGIPACFFLPRERMADQDDGASTLRRDEHWQFVNFVAKVLEILTTRDPYE